MNIRKTSKILILVSVISVIFGSCIIDTIPAGYGIRNCTNDTLLIEPTKSDTLDYEMYWSKNSKDTIERLLPNDTTEIYVHGEKVILRENYYTLPDSALYFWPNVSDRKDTFYIYAIKWQIAKHYTIEEIRAKKLYDRRPVTKKDFNDNRIFEYRPAESARSH